MNHFRSVKKHIRHSAAFYSTSVDLEQGIISNEEWLHETFIAANTLLRSTGNFRIIKNHYYELELSDKYIGICLYTNKALSGGEETDDHDAKKKNTLCHYHWNLQNEFVFLPCKAVKMKKRNSCAGSFDEITGGQRSTNIA